jgi:transcription elongation GreA/GreB family factor
MQCVYAFFDCDSRVAAMSKAFTDEEALTTAVPGRAVQRAPTGDERPMTARGYAALQARLVTATEALRGADEMTREPLAHALALLTATSESVRVVDIPPVEEGVRFGHVVELSWDDGRVSVVQVVGPDEAEGRTRVSVLAPLGQALIGQKIGDVVELERPRGFAIATIRRVTTPVD